MYADALSASQRGLAVRPMRRPAKPESLPQAPARIGDCADPAFAMGYKTVGPILVAFTRLLLDPGRGGTGLAFVARDGELLLRVAQEIGAESVGGLALLYLHLSRRAAACASPDLQHLLCDPGAVERLKDCSGKSSAAGSGRYGWNSIDFGFPQLAIVVAESQGSAPHVR